MIKIRLGKAYSLSAWFNLRMVVFLLALAGMQLHAFADGKDGIKISGTVTSSTDNMGLPGVTVVEKGTSKGTITDLNGKFSLEVSNSNAIIVVSFMGFESQTISLNGRTDVNIVLKEKVEAINEVVVIGYGTAKKKDITGASVTVGQEALKNNVSANLDQALQGRAAGVTAVVTSGQPGASVSVRIRGISTINANATEPLYIIDGVQVQNSSLTNHGVGLGSLGNGASSSISGLSSINPADILSMEILKDANATAIYGSQAANGVVIITTKRGKSGDAKFNYEFSTGIQEQVKRVDVMNLQEFASYSNQFAAETSGRDPRAEFQDPSILGNGTNWQDATYRVASMQNHQLSATGGTDKISYYVSGGYFKQDGTVIGSDYKRYSARVNLDARLNSWMKLGTNISMSSTDEHIGLTNSTEGIISVALKSLPDVPIYNIDGSFAGQTREGSVGYINPIALATQMTNTLKRKSLNGSTYLELNLMKDLTFRSTLGVDVGNINASNFTPTYKFGTVVNTVNKAFEQKSQSFFWQNSNVLTYTKSIKNHNAVLLLGHEVQEYGWEYLSGEGSGLSSNEVHEPGLGEQTTMKVNSGRSSGSKVSAFARADYNFNNKYYFSYTYRLDGSSNFGPNNRWAPFHSVGGSWRLSEEPFMKQYSQISNLKLRASWGQTGNQNIGGYKWGAAISKMPTSLGPGYRQTNLENRSIQWEKQEAYNLGFDIGVLQDRISLTVEAYIKKSNDMLMTMQLPSYMGTSGNASIRLYAPSGNYGAIENKGLELELKAKPFVGDFSWEASAQVTINRNKLLELNGTPAAYLSGYGQWTDEVTRTRLGESLFNFYGYKVAGVYTDRADIENSPKPKKYPSNGINFQRGSSVWVGDLKYQDLSGPNGTPDGVIDDYDRTNIGSPLPLFTYGINNTFKYKGFELNLFITGSYGNKVMNYVGRSLSGMETMWSNQLRTAVDRAVLAPIDPNKKYPFEYTYELAKPATATTAAEPAKTRWINYWYEDVDNVKLANPGTSVPRAVAGDPNENMRISDRYIEDGSYIRFKSLSLSYYIPEKYTLKAGIKGLKVYANVQNLWTITKYTGFDPEIGTSQSSDNVYGLDNGRYPSPRIYTIGANITF